jgi:hypothetical protein
MIFASSSETRRPRAKYPAGLPLVSGLNCVDGEPDEPGLNSVAGDGRSPGRHCVDGLPDAPGFEPGLRFVRFDDDSGFDFDDVAALRLVLVPTRTCSRDIRRGAVDHRNNGSRVRHVSAGFASASFATHRAMC